MNPTAQIAPLQIVDLLRWIRREFPRAGFAPPALIKLGHAKDGKLFLAETRTVFYQNGEYPMGKKPVNVVMDDDGRAICEAVFLGMTIRWPKGDDRWEDPIL